MFWFRDTVSDLACSFRSEGEMLSVVVARSYLGGRCLVFSPEESQTCFCWASQSSLGEAFSSQSEKEAGLLSVSFLNSLQIRQAA